MRVAFYMHDFSGGGVERSRLVLFDGLADRGVRVSAIVQARRGALLCRVPADLPIHDLASRHTLADVLPLRRILRSGAFDIVFSDLDHNNAALLLARLLAGGRTQVVIAQHNALSAEARANWRYRPIPLLYRLLWRLADAVIVVSGGVAADLRRTAGIPASAVTLIYNPVVGPDVERLACAAVPHSWLADASTPVFVSAGRLTAQKDPHTALRALARRLQQGPARLIFLGEGTLAASLAAEAERLGIAGHVLFAGFQLNPLAWIARARALVLSSRYEGFGNVVVEALACGTPVIATDCPHGPAEILEDGRFGTLVPVGDADALASAMTIAIDAQVSRAALRSRAAAFTAERCIEAHRQLIARLRMNARAGPRLFGFHLCELDAPGVARRVLAGRPAGVALLVTPNIDHVRLLRQADFRQAYAGAAILCPDGFPLVLYARLRGGRASRRVTGCDVLAALLADPSLAQHRVFVVAEAEATAAALRRWWQAQAMEASLRVAVAPPGLAHDEQGQSRLCRDIADHDTTLLVMTLGAPVSEIFVDRNRGRLPPCWAVCVGQAVRVVVGLADRPPAPWRDLGLEWAWRLWREPRRLARRYGLAALWLPVAIWRDLLGSAAER